jgi:hypothetical protein
MPQADASACARRVPDQSPALPQGERLLFGSDDNAKPAALLVHRARLGGGPRRCQMTLPLTVSAMRR